MKKLWIIISIIVLVAIAIVLCYPSQKGPINIGAILPLTGDAGFYGESIQKGINMAVDEINEKGGINSRKINVIYEDSKASPMDGVTVFNRLINIHKVPVVIGDAVSSVTLAIAPIAEKNKVVVLSPLSSAPDITNAGDFIFRNVPSDLFGGKVAAYFAVRERGWRSLSILYINNSFGVGLKKVFSDEVTTLGGNIVASEAYEEASTDFRTQLTKIKAVNPDAIFLVGYQEVSQALIQAVELGIKATFLGTGLLEDTKFVDMAKGSAEGVFFTQLQYATDSLDPVTKNFVDAFKKKYNSEPNIITAYGYDAMKVLSSAMMKGSLSSKSIKEELYKTKSFKGVTGEISFDANGDVIQPMGIKVIKNGKFEWYKREVLIY